MSFARLLAVVALSFWIGGLAALGLVAAPVLFDTLQVHDPVAGRELAGVTFGAIFDRFQQAAWLAGGVLLLSLGLRAALGPRPRLFFLRLWTAAVMLAASVAVVEVVTPRIEAIRSATRGPVAGLAADDPRRVEFGRWHGLSTGLMLLTIVAGVGLLWTETRDRP